MVPGRRYPGWHHGRGVASLRFLQHRLSEVGLKLNNDKVEIYAEEVVMLPLDMPQLHQIHNREQWSYLGIPLAPGQSASAKSTLHRLHQVCAALIRMAPRYPRQALIILRTCTGGCRIELLAQAVPSDEWPSRLTHDLSEIVLRAAEAIVGMPFSGNAGIQAQLGPGLYDPVR